MSWKIIDVSTGNTFVSKNGNVFDNVTDETKTDFEQFHARKGDGANFRYEKVADPYTGGRSTYEQRKEYFKNTSPTLAEMFPNLAERQMQGDDNFVADINAGVSDALSYPGRMVAAIGNKVLGNDEGYNLGRRSGEPGGSGFGNGLRNPSTIPSLLIAPGLKAGKTAFDIGKRLISGAVTGAELEGLDASMNGREPNYAVGATFGGGMEGVGVVAGLARELMRKFGVNLERAVASALRLGNTDRVLTEREFREFMADPDNMSSYRKTMEAVTSGRNASPFVTDRGKALMPAIEEAENKGVQALSGQAPLERGWSYNIDMNLPVTEQRIARQKNALNDKDVETYTQKTVFKPGKKDVSSDAFPTDYATARTFGKPEGKTGLYQSPMEYNLERFADKWDNIGKSINGAPTHYGPMTPDEVAILKKMRENLDGDLNLINGYTPEKLIETNKFLGDRVPFNNSFLDKEVGAFLDARGRDGVSSKFVEEVNRINGEALSNGERVMRSVRDPIEGKNAAVVERAFAYMAGDEAKIAVKKGYRDAVDKFSDSLSDYVDRSSGEIRKNAKNEQYVVDKDRMKKYAYTYLDKVQKALEKNGALDPKDVIGLYGEAVKVNDAEVQKFVIELLEDLKIDKGVIENFKKESRDYVMLNKARTRLKKNATDNSNPLQGTTLAPIYPQEGVNTANILGYMGDKVLGKVEKGLKREGLYDIGDYAKAGAYQTMLNR